MRAPPRDVIGVKSKQHRRRSALADGIPTSLQDLLFLFSGCFTRPSFESFTSLVVGWITCRGSHQITRMIQAGGAVGSKHFSCFHRFLSRARWSPDDLGAVILKLAEPWLPDLVEALIDDTLCHRGGPRIFGVAMHHDGANSSRGWSRLSCGHNWVVLAIRIPLPWDRERGAALPIFFRLYRSPKRCKAHEYHKRTELARELIGVLRDRLPTGKRLHVAGDREYACKTLVRSLDESVDFTGPMPMDAALYAPAGEYSGVGRPRKRGERLRSPAQQAKCGSKWIPRTVRLYGRDVELLVQDWTCLWYTAAGTRLVRVILTRDPKRKREDRAYFTTDVDTSAIVALERYARRWLIEVSFRDAKQLLGIEQPQNGWSRGKRQAKKPGPQPRGNRGRHAVLRTAPLGWTVYALVVIWYLRQGRWQSEVRRLRDSAPWYRQKATPSFADMLDALRIEIEARRLIDDPAEKGALQKTRNRLRRHLRAA